MRNVAARNEVRVADWLEGSSLVLLEVLVVIDKMRDDAVFLII
jgi:hypothetical protein